MKWVRKEVEHDPSWLEYHCQYQDCFGKVFRNSCGDWRVIVYTNTNSVDCHRLAVTEVFDTADAATDAAERIMVSESQEAQPELFDDLGDLMDCFDGETVEGGVDSENDAGCEGGACKL